MSTKLDYVKRGETIWWCEKHRLPKADGIEDVCAIGYMPLFDADEDLPCRLVEMLLSPLASVEALATASCATCRGSGRVREYDHPESGGDEVMESPCPDCGIVTPTTGRLSGLPIPVESAEAKENTMNDLRIGLVEAMARSGYEGDAWDHADEMQRILWRTDARIKLDAALGFLTDNAEAWWQAWFESERPLYESFPVEQHLPQLIAVLRDRDRRETPT